MYVHMRTRDGVYACAHARARVTRRRSRILTSASAYGTLRLRARHLLSPVIPASRFLQTLLSKAGLCALVGWIPGILYVGASLVLTLMLRLDQPVLQHSEQDIAAASK
jgi:hypothetical protein